MRTAEGLRAAGVADSAIHVIETEVDSLEAALAIGEPGDLLLVFCDKISRSWKQIIYHHTQRGGTAPLDPAQPFAPSAPALMDDDAGSASGAFVRDERGVRIARSEEAD